MSIRLDRSVGGGIAARLGVAVLCAGVAGSVASPSSAKSRVACVGASITYGATIDPLQGNTYPDRLQAMLGDDYEVGNLDSSYGRPGTTVTKAGDDPYWNVSEFTSSTAFDADIYVILLGTNDSKPQNWKANGRFFARDYAALIEHYRRLPTHPAVYACLLPPVLRDGAYGMNSAVVADRINPEIRRVAARTGAYVVDTYTPFVGHPEYFSEGVHPNATGALVLADTVYRAIVLSMRAHLQGGISSGRYTFTPLSAAATRLDATDKSRKSGTPFRFGERREIPTSCGS